METSDLILAFNIRTIAVELQSKARSTFFQSTYERTEPEKKFTELAEWDRTHPFEMYIDAALHELRHISKQIKPFIQT